MSVILKQIHSVPTFSSEIMAWAIFTFRQARTHAVSLSVCVSLSLSLCLMNGIGSGPLWLCSNLPLKISTIFPIKKDKPERPHTAVFFSKTHQRVRHLLISAYTFTHIYKCARFLRYLPQPKGPRGLCQEPPRLCQPTGVWRPFEGGNLSNRTIELKCTLVRSALSLPLCTITCLVLK